MWRLVLIAGLLGLAPGKRFNVKFKAEGHSQAENFETSKDGTESCDFIKNQERTSTGRVSEVILVCRFPKQLEI